MGAWGFESFENDEAADWVYEFEKSGREALDLAFAAILGLGPEDYLEAPLAIIAIAAAEFVAAAKDGDQSNLSEAAKEAFVALSDVPASVALASVALASDADKALKRILQASELRELWEETDDFEDWRADVEALMSRLE
jgi:hypothetical protein